MISATPRFLAYPRKHIQLKQLQLTQNKRQAIPSRRMKGRRFQETTPLGALMKFTKFK
jgi:hypothetical protein